MLADDPSGEVQLTYAPTGVVFEVRIPLKPEKHPSNATRVQPAASPTENGSASTILKACLSMGEPFLGSGQSTPTTWPIRQN